MTTNYCHNPDHDQALKSIVKNEKNEGLRFAFDHGRVGHHSLAVNASKDEDEDERSPRERYHGHDTHHSSIVTNHHGPIVKPYDMQLYDRKSHHGRDDDHGLAMMALEKSE